MHTYPVGILWTSDQSVVEAATYTTHNKHKTRTSIHTSGFEPAILEIETVADLRLKGARLLGSAFHYVYSTKTV